MNPSTLFAPEPCDFGLVCVNLRLTCPRHTWRHVSPAQLDILARKHPHILYSCGDGVGAEAEGGGRDGRDSGANLLSMLLGAKEALLAQHTSITNAIQV